MNPLAPTDLPRGRTALSVNVNKVALLRNTRSNGVPDVVHAARLALQAGAHGITVHPRPDQRHIRADDVPRLAALVGEWPAAEYNVEGNPLHNLMDVLRALRAAGAPVHQCTFVPDSVDQATSDHGWRLPADAPALRECIGQARELGVRVSLFMDPDPQAMAGVRELGAQRVELYTESYARAHGTPQQRGELDRFAATARAALAEGLDINAGHDLNRANLTDFLRAVPGVVEVSIGHALIADAIELGMAQTVGEYLQCIQRAALPR